MAMAVVSEEVTFDGRAPALSLIADKVSALSGLSVSVKDSGADVKGNLHDLHARLTFACAPEEQLELYAYRPGAVKEFAESWPGPSAQFLQGLHEPAGAQVVYLRSYNGLEPTLMVVTGLALEALGGRPRAPIPEDVRRAYGRPITAAQLEARRRKACKQAWGACLVGVALLPVLLPLWLVGFALSLVLLPWRIWKAYQLYRAWIERRGGSPNEPLQPTGPA
jgi:hypothetical protein